MVTIRCTRKLLRYLDAKPSKIDTRPTTILGDWYANLLFTRHARLVICVSERALLPVFVRAKDRSTFAERFQEAAIAVLERIGATAGFVDREMCEMLRVEFGTTSSRRVLGSLNELSFLSRELIDESSGIDLTHLAVEIAETPCSLINYESPRLMTLALLRDHCPDH